jgi:hypothetical protein
MLVPMAMSDLISDEVAYLIYLGCFAIGLIFSLLLGLLGGVFDLGAGDVDIDANVDITADAVGLSPLSPIVICVFLTVFGGIGIITEEFEIPLLLGAGIAATAAAVIALGFSAAMSWLMTRANSSMDLNPESIVGKQAEVSVTIPENGLGEITYVLNKMRQRASARSQGGESIRQSTIVDVVKYSGNFYVVTPGD